MSDSGINGIGSNIDPLKSGTKGVNEDKGGGFDKVLNEALTKVSQVQKDVDAAVTELSTGGDITSAVLAIEKADMTFQLMVEVRNKLMRTYDEVMKLQI
ncbi:MAG: flagellar hook-basal body complex protein FliE [Nitrospira sp.]|nr:flagellar hook-basal body complex protein FliE [Nitrospira sp.]